MNDLTKKVLAIIPARGGSKRIPRKNIKSFAGKPMIHWPLEELKKNNLIKDILVSTDDDEIKRTVELLDIKVPYTRPSELSDDFTGTAKVVKHAVDWYMNNVSYVDYILTVYPTAVFLNNEDIIEAAKLLNSDDDTQIVFSGTEFSFPIQRAVSLDKKNNVKMFQTEHVHTRSQDLTKAYHDAGQFYLYRINAAIKEYSALEAQSKMIVLPRDRVVDIDEPEDFRLAEKLFSFFKN